jgi:hypothetical protein
MNKPLKPPQNDVAGPNSRRTTTQVMVGNVAVGAPIVDSAGLAIRRNNAKPMTKPRSARRPHGLALNVLNRNDVKVRYSSRSTLKNA